MNFRIATWNMDNWKSKKFSEESWKYLDSLDTDIALVQEAVPLTEDDSIIWQPIDEKYRRWGSGVYSHKWKFTKITKAKSKDYAQEFELLNTHRGCVAIAQVDLPNDFLLTVISCYGLMINYAQTTMFRIIADLIPLFDDLKLGKNVIFAGDLNIGTQQKTDMGERKRHQAILEGIKSLGLVDCLELTKNLRTPLEDCPCPEAPNCGHVITHHHNRGRKIQNDYIFATESLSKKLKRCYAVDEQNGFPLTEEGKWKLSDHCPLIAEFDL
jgi:exonuclease III